MAELKKLRQNLELLGDDAKEAKAHEIEEKADELQRFRTATARDLGRERDKVAKEILKEIQQSIERYGSARGFAMIIDDRSLLYGQPAYDLTDDILKTLNAQAPAPAAAPPVAPRKQ